MSEVVKIETLDSQGLLVNNTKIAQTLPKVENAIGNKFMVACLNNKDILTVVGVSDKENVEIRGNITATDMAVLDVVCTLFDMGRDYFTLDQAVQLYTGSGRIGKATEKTKATVKNSIRKLMGTVVRIDCSDEFRERGLIEKDEKRIYNGNMVYLEYIEDKKVAYEANGKMPVDQTIYHFISKRKPVLLDYAQHIGQLRTMPLNLLCTNKNIDLSVVVSRSIWARIENMKYQKEHFETYNNKICLYRIDKTTKNEKGVMVDIGYPKENTAAWRKKKERVCDIIEKQLELMIASGDIVSYDKYSSSKSPNSIDGYQIIL